MPLDPSLPPSLTAEGRLLERLATLERRVQTLEGRDGQLPVVTALPTAGRPGRQVFYAGAVRTDTGTAWV